MSLLSKASLVLTPNAIKEGKIHSIIPSNGNGDMSFVRATTATRVNELGLIENVGINIPRLNYDVAGGCPSILLEPQRTNLLLNSVGGGIGYDTFGSVVLTNNFANSPDNTITATRINASAGVWRYRNNNTTTLLPNTTYTFTLFAKSNTSGNQTFRMLLYNANFSTDLVATPQWKKFTFTSTTLSTVTQIHGIGADTLNNLADIQTWGWQIEQGAYPTSYIPTLASAITRNSDNISGSNIYTNGLITSAGGTWFIEFINNIAMVRDLISNLYLGDNISASSGNSFSFRNNGANARLSLVKRVDGVATTIFLTVTDTIKVAIKWNGTTADVFVNGVKVVTGTAFTTTNMEFLGGNGSDVPKYIKSMLLFPTALSDSELTQLTTL